MTARLINARHCRCPSCPCGTGHKACQCASPYYPRPACLGFRPIARLAREGNDWLAYADGRGAPIIRPVPGNTHPASGARWREVDEAARELAAWGFDVAVFALRGIVTPLCSVRATLDAQQGTADRYNADPFVEPGTADPDAPYTVEATTLDRIEAETGQRWAVTP